MFMHAMVFSRVEYCLTKWSFTNAITLGKVESLYKSALKTFAKKHLTYHHGHIQDTYNLLHFKNVTCLKLACNM